MNLIVAFLVKFSDWVSLRSPQAEASDEETTYFN